MAVLSGKTGTLKLAGKTITPITDWKMVWISEGRVYAANDTGGAVRRLPGLDDCSGTFDCRVSEGGHCPVARGDSVLAQFHVDGSGQNYYEVRIAIGSIALHCDIAKGGPLNFAMEFQGDGPVSAHGVVAKA
jgi:hypothetical protein